MASAAFLVNDGDPAGGVAVSASSTVNLALESTVGVSTVVWSIEGNHSSDATNPTITPAGSPSGATASFPMPAGDGQSYIVQAKINNGRNANGQVDESYTFRALVGVNNDAGMLPFAAGETYERSETHGYTEALNTVANNIGGGGTVTGTGTNEQIATWSGASAIGGSSTLTTSTGPGNGRVVTLGGSSTTGSVYLTLQGDSATLVFYGDDGVEIGSWSADADGGSSTLAKATGKTLAIDATSLALTTALPLTSGGTGLSAAGTKGQVLVTDGSAFLMSSGVKTKSADLTDANATVNVSDGSRFILPASTLSTGRTLTLGTSGSPMNGETVTIERYDATANTYAVANGGPAGGTIFTFPVSVKRTANFYFDGTNWVYLNTWYLP
jgi:hypothetical protein